MKKVINKILGKKESIVLWTEDNKHIDYKTRRSEILLKKEDRKFLKIVLSKDSRNDNVSFYVADVTTFSSIPNSEYKEHLFEIAPEDLKEFAQALTRAAANVSVNDAQ